LASSQMSSTQRKPTVTKAAASSLLSHLASAAMQMTVAL
jgi:hypothetical protein